MTRLAQCLTTVLAAAGLAATAGAGAVSAAAPPTLALKVLLIGEGSADVTTAAWQAALTSEGVPYTLVTATGTAPNEKVSLPACPAALPATTTAWSSPTPRLTTRPGH